MKVYDKVQYIGEDPNLKEAGPGILLQKVESADGRSKFWVQWAGRTRHSLMDEEELKVVE